MAPVPRVHKAYAAISEYFGSGKRGDGREERDDPGIQKRGVSGGNR